MVDATFEGAPAEMLAGVLYDAGLLSDNGSESFLATDLGQLAYVEYVDGYACDPAVAEALRKQDLLEEFGLDNSGDINSRGYQNLLASM